MHSNKPFESATHIAKLGNATLYLDVEGFQGACDYLVNLNGGTGTPKVTALSNPSIVDSNPAIVSRSEIKAAEMDEEGCQRSQEDFDSAVAAGFAPEQTVFARGLRVNDTGVQNAKTFRQEFEDMPKAKDNCTDFCQRITEENRQATVASVHKLRLLSSGDLKLPSNNKISINQHAFAQICRRAGDEIASGARYLSHCPSELRANNVNNWMAEYEYRLRKEQAKWDGYVANIGTKRTKQLYGRRPTEQSSKLLTRNNSDHSSGREVFGVVGKNFPHQFNVSQIAEAIAEVAPPEARGTVTYDGNKARFQMLFHSTVQPEHYVAGEFFRAGVQIRTDDTGGGSCIIDAIVWQNLCLNLIVIDQCVQNIVRLAHKSRANVLAEKFDKGIQQALQSIKTFTERWGYAMEEDVLVRTAKATPDFATELMSAHTGGVPIAQVLPGLFNGIIERELVPVRGRRPEVVKNLLLCYDQDTTNAANGKLVPISRAGIVNAFTRYANEVEAKRSLWGEDDIQKAAGQLLTPRTKGAELPPPIPYEPIALRA